MFWPNIDIAKHVHSCVLCQTVSNSQQKEPAIPIEVSSRPWEVLGMDMYYLYRKCLAFLLRK